MSVEKELLALSKRFRHLAYHQDTNPRSKSRKWLTKRLETQDKLIREIYYTMAGLCNVLAKATKGSGEKAPAPRVPRPGGGER